MNRLLSGWSLCALALSSGIVSAEERNPAAGETQKAAAPVEAAKAAAPATGDAPKAAASTADSSVKASATAEGGRIYIPIGQPNVRKVLLAIEPTDGDAALASSFRQTLVGDMDFTDLFEFLPESKIPSDRELAGYRGMGVEFLLRSRIVLSGKQVQAEVRLFDVPRGVQILGRLYPFVSNGGQAARELAHFAGNDIMKALTGEEGVFRTRILMSCGGRNKEIYIMDFDGQNVRQLTKDRNFALSPSWSPDGKRMLFTSYKPAVAGGPLNPNLYSFDLVTNQRRLLSAARGLNSGGIFHPKENKLAYTFSQNGKPEIYILDLRTNSRFSITHTQYFSVEPDWSPDGMKLAYSSSQSGRPHIYVSNADGSAPKRLTFAGVYNSSPKWSPRGDRIVFSGQETMGNNFNIFMIDPNGSNLVRLTDGAKSSENPVFSPDGRYLAFSSNQGGAYRIYVMTFFGTKIRAISPPGLGPCKQPAWSPRL